MVTEEPDNADPTSPQEGEVGAYAQFTQQQLRWWAIRIAIAGGLLILLLWAVAGGLNLFDEEAENGLANLVAVWLLTFGSLAFLIGVVLQLASLRVAKLRSDDGLVKSLEFGGGDLGGIVKTIGDVLKSAKVPVAAMFVGAVLMVMGGLIAFESLEHGGEADHPEEAILDEGRFEEERLELNRELERTSRILSEICNVVERSDRDFPRDLPRFGELLREACG